LYKLALNTWKEGTGIRFHAGRSLTVWHEPGGRIFKIIHNFKNSVILASC